MRTRRRAVVSPAVSPVVETLEGRALLSGAGLWTIVGDAAGARSNDDILLDRNLAGDLRATLNGSVLATRPASDISAIDVWAGRGNDTVRVELGAGFAAPVRVFGGKGADRLVGDAGAQSFDGGAGSDSIDAGGGGDSLAGGDGDDELAGGTGDDALSGDGGLDTLAGNDGRDRLFGGTGADQLDGGNDRDKLDGGDDRDAVHGGAGRDAIAGGPGRDRLYVEDGLDGVDRDSDDRLRGDDVTLPVTPVGHDAFIDAQVDGGLQRNADRLGQAAYPLFSNHGCSGMCGPDPIRAGYLGTAGSGGASDVPDDKDFSGTNVQVDGVDEADFVETDGRLIYALDGNRLLITDTQTHTLITQWGLGAGEIRGMYLHGDRLTVIAWLPADGQPPPPPYNEFGEIEGSYDYYDTQTRVTVYDVSAPTQPAIVEDTYLDGIYVTSRAIGDKVYVAVGDWLYPADPLTTGGTFETEQDYRDRLADGGFGNEIPHFRASLADGTTREGLLVDGSHLYAPSGANLVDTPVTTLALIDTGDAVPGPVATASVINEDIDLHAARESLYVMMPSYVADDATDVLKFSLGPDSIDLAATGRFKGYIYNPFSADDDGRYFRVASTSGAYGDDLTNGVYVMDQIGDDLVVVGALPGIAPGKQVTAARFDGDRAYVATARASNPLYTIDLTNPTAPVIAGRLAVPGYANYIQPVDGNHLIAFGRGDPDPATGATGPLEVSLFDVADLRNPRRVAVHDIDPPGGGWLTSLGETDHHAIAYFPGQHVLVFPVTDRRKSAVRYRLEAVSVPGGAALAPLGTVPHSEPVLRGVRIGDLLHSVGTDGVRTVRIDDPDEAISYVPF